MSGFNHEQMLIPPHSIEAEQSVLGGLLLSGLARDDSAWERVDGVVTEADFYRNDHRLIFRAMAALVADNLPIDLTMVSEWLRQRGELETVHGFAYLATLSSQTPSAANIAAYAETIKNMAVLRRLISLSQAVQAAAFSSSASAADVKGVIEKLASGVFSIELDQSKGERGLMPIKPLLRDEVGRLEALSQAGGEQMLGKRTGLADLDAVLLGLERGKVYIIAAVPGMGKTTLGLNLLEKVAMDGGTCAFFSTEMPAGQVVQKLVSSAGLVDFGKLREPWKMQADDWGGVSGGVKQLAGTSIFIDDSSTLTPSDARVRVRRMARETGKPVDLIMFDYVQIMAGSKQGGYAIREQEIAHISQEVRQMAKDFDCPILLLSQLNRAVANRPNKRPVMSDLRESGALEQDASAIIFIYRDEEYNPETAEPGVAELIIAKNRGGQKKTVKTTFRGNFQRFETIAHYTPDHAQGGGWK